MKKVKEPTIPRLSWQNGKTYATSLGDNAGRSGHASEHVNGIVENASRDFMTRVTLASASLRGALDVPQTVA